MEEPKHWVYAYINRNTLHAMFREARRRHIFLKDDGKVDVGALITELITAFAEGRYQVKGLDSIKHSEPDPDQDRVD